MYTVKRNQATLLSEVDAAVQSIESSGALEDVIIGRVYQFPNSSGNRHERKKITSLKQTGFLEFFILFDAFDMWQRSLLFGKSAKTEVTVFNTADKHLSLNLIIV